MEYDIECVYCGKILDPGNYGKYHGEKCKLKRHKCNELV